MTGFPCPRYCDCADPRCPVHPGQSDCGRLATHALARIDMGLHLNTEPIFACEGCAEDMLSSGVFTELDDDPPEEK